MIQRIAKDFCRDWDLTTEQYNDLIERLQNMADEIQTTPVLGKRLMGSDKVYQMGWFDGVEECLNTIDVLLKE